MEIILASCASLLAGLIDSIVGGGGLILVPALFTIFPNAAPATLFGTNKCAAVWGTSMATVTYTRRVSMRWPVMLPAALMAFAGSFVGAWAVTLINPGFLRRLLPFILLAVLLYTLAKKELGSTHAPYHSQKQATIIACGIGGLIGCYDGFFGPGTGSFFIFLFVRFLNYDFLHASAAAKLLNVATNLAALTLFALKGHIWWHIGLTMGVANIIGSIAGTRLALKHGATFIRYVFVVVVSLLILKTGIDGFLK